ncbi:uncharacterized protein LOC131009909 [Salvia miltiorrhiza]|uniref:uncharacterized protein LOC131009909 n=1 Tax=Salvia miltiorrhiza TaxID=226208 RepID=UPI0025ABF41F|nr:uncharacterized protein LOC131009909 [Salvia miltiorrhiza]
MEKGGREEEGEWREVRRRHLQKPNLRDNQPHPTVENHFVKKTHGKEEETFFFNNFLEETRIQYLERRFKEIGRVIYIFYPKKRDIRGKPFGFVRFQKRNDRDWILEEMNNIWIGSYKTRAYLPRFDRPLTETLNNKIGGVGNHAKERNESKRRVYNIPKGLRESGKTFAEALGGINKNHTPPADEVISFQASNEEMKWSQNSFTGFVKAEFAWEDFEEEINSKYASILKVSTLGGNLVLIQSLNQTHVKELMKELDEWTKFWFEWTRPWSYVDVSTQRMVWTKWHGVPLQAWNTRFFEMVGARMGMVFKIHEVTKRRERLDAAFIQISTGLYSLNKIVESKINGAHFKIHIEELSEQMPPEEPLTKEDATSEEEDDEVSLDKIY